jgi:hypothetical protein
MKLEQVHGEDAGSIGFQRGKTGQIGRYGSTAPVARQANLTGMTGFALIRK